MKNIQPFAVALLSFLGIETLTLSSFESLTKILCQVTVTVFTCIYIYRKTKQFKK